MKLSTKPHKSIGLVDVPIQLHSCRPSMCASGPPTESGRTAFVLQPRWGLPSSLEGACVERIPRAHARTSGSACKGPSHPFVRRSVPDAPVTAQATVAIVLPRKLPRALNFQL